MRSLKSFYLSHDGEVKIIQFADLAHLVERDLAKVEVAGSSPVIRSIK